MTTTKQSLREENLVQVEILQGFPNFARAPKQQALPHNFHFKLKTD